MAKDPATLWYWNDWHGGTAILTRHLKGCYMDLLHAQFNSGRLSLEHIETVLGSDFNKAWPILKDKFKQDEEGRFYNQRAEDEKVRRCKYSESRRRNVTKRYNDKSTHVESMKHHMENETTCINNNSKGSTHVEHMKIPNHYREPIRPTKNEVWEVMVSCGGTKEMARSFYSKYEATGWFLNGSPITNFKPLAQKFVDSWKRNDKAKEKDVSTGYHTPPTIIPDSNI